MGDALHLKDYTNTLSLSSRCHTPVGPSRRPRQAWPRPSPPRSRQSPPILLAVALVASRDNVAVELVFVESVLQDLALLACRVFVRPMPFGVRSPRGLLPLSPSCPSLRACRGHARSVIGLTLLGAVKRTRRFSATAAWSMAGVLLLVDMSALPSRREEIRAPRLPDSVKQLESESIGT